MGSSGNGNGRKLPPLARTLLKWIAVVGPVCAAVYTIATTVIDIQSRAREANSKTEAGYETLAPALTELQGLAGEMQEWAEDTDREIHELKATRADHERRIMRLEMYIEILSNRRNLPAAPPMPAHDVAVDVGSMSLIDKPARRPSKKVGRPARPVPLNVIKAKAYQQQRDKLDCPPGDPSCGLFE